MTIEFGHFVVVVVFVKYCWISVSERIFSCTLYVLPLTTAADLEWRDLFATFITTSFLFFNVVLVLDAFHILPCSVLVILDEFVNPKDVNNSWNDMM